MDPPGAFEDADPRVETTRLVEAGPQLAADLAERRGSQMEGAAGRTPDAVDREQPPLRDHDDRGPVRRGMPEFERIARVTEWRGGDVHRRHCLAVPSHAPPEHRPGS